ncbi:Hint domain-containing protein [Acidiphilium sp. C61]|jgi:hypothetical protein|uniref:Hint domain-containing protein n=1 Tax=Acidiphilium sp. C61 TaxID=1671485 RepID=UPI001F24A27E|nr:Hint domain-containing protein [Acidiphilium sp. C61]
MATNLNGTWSAVNTNGTTQYLSNGVTVTGLVNLDAGATLIVEQGATASGLTNTGAGVTINVSGGGVVENSTLSGASLQVSSGGSSLNNFIVGSGGLITVAPSGIVSGTFVSAGAAANFQNGAIVDQATANNTQRTLLNGYSYWSAVNNNGTTVYTNGSTTVSGLVELAGGTTLNIESGAVVSGMIVDNGGTSKATVNVSAGGELLSSVINNAYMYGYGGTTSGNVINGGMQTYNGGSSVNDTFINNINPSTYMPTVYFNVGTTLSGALVESGGNIAINTGATVSNIIAGAGGTISSGGMATTQYNEPVLTGGTVSAVNVNGTTQYLSNGQTIAGPVALGANTTLIVESGAVVSGNAVTFGAGDTVSVNSGGELLSASLSGGTLDVTAGGVTSGNALTSDSVNISSGGESIGDTFSSGTNTTVSSGGQVFSPLEATSGATLTVSSGGIFNPNNPNNPCFAAGTLIATARGPVAVEHLTAGETVLLHDGGTAPVVWLGKRTIDLTRHPRPEAVQPVVISANAIADNVPARDLVVSPDHAFYLEGVLIPAKILVNGTTIRQVTMREVTYFHVELPFHAVLLAEGMATESYLETGNRGAFENGGEALILHPDFAQSLRETRSCAPFADHGPLVERARARILDRAAIETTQDAAVVAIHRQDGSVVIASRTAVPGELTADPRDRRVLGVKIGALKAGGEPIALDHPGLAEGWHDVEPNGRWTNGAAVIPAELVQGRNVEITIATTLAYPVTADSRMASVG